MFGKLTLEAVPFHEPIIMITLAVVAIAGLGIFGAITYYRKWGYLWTEWLTSVDHKKIGVMYILVALIMLLRGFADAIMMRGQLAIAEGASQGYLPPEHYDQIFTAHGVIMIIFMAMPFMVGLMNIAVPLQIGARDVAFPFLNSLSFWLFVAGAILVNVSLGVGEFARTGWVAYPPLAELGYSPGVGVDYYIWALQLSGLGTLLTGVNFLVTVFKMRAPGMSWMKIPVFTWACTFTNLFWAWGHPEVYILILPAFGIFSEVISTFSGKKLFGYASMIWASGAITVLGFVVWLHHFFTMGSGANVNAFFGVATMVIAVPTGVKLFSWLFTMFRGRVQFTTPVLWTLGFMVTFTVGGMTGVLLAVPGADYVLHNSLFLIAHFHNTIIGGAVFGYLAGFTFWFPKAFGFKLDERLGKGAFWCWITGFFVAFMPLYVLGFMGMTRRLNHYDNPMWQPYLIVAFFGAGLILCGILFQLAQLVVSLRNRESLRDVTGDPWGGRTLEWSTSSPPPFYNFAVTPTVRALDAFQDMKERGEAYLRPDHYAPIHMPKNTSAGVIIGLLGAVFGFALVWHIWWLGAVSFIGMIATFIARSYNEDVDYYVQPDEIERVENRHHANFAAPRSVLNTQPVAEQI